jgi:hypothetical protein
VHAAFEHTASLNVAISTLAHYALGRYNPRKTGLICAAYATGAADVAHST